LGDRHLGRRPDQPTSEALCAWLAEAQDHLKHKAVVLDGSAVHAAAMGIREQAQRHAYDVWALAVLPDHVHLVVGRHWHRYERVVAGMKAVSGREVRKLWGIAVNERPNDLRQRQRDTRPVWSDGYWVRYLNDDTHIASAVRYVVRNPASAGLPPQRWSFLSPIPV